MSIRSNILVIDDEKPIFDKIKKALPAHNVFHIDKLIGASQKIEQKKVDLAIVDLNLRGKEKNVVLTGLDFIKTIRDRHPAVEVIVHSSYRDIDRVSQAIKNGASEYLYKGKVNYYSVDFREMINQIVRAKKERDTRREKLKSVIWGKSAATTNVIKYLAANAQDPAHPSFFLFGPNGVGKDKIVQFVHYTSAFYSDTRELVTLDLSLVKSKEIMKVFQIPSTSKKKSFLKEARKNILYLKHIEYASFEVQNAFYYIITQQKYVNENASLPVQVILSTEQPPLELIRNGKLMPNLYNDLSQLEILPLIDRKKDLYEMIPKWMEAMEYPPELMDETIFELFLQYDYPGNQSELFDLLQQTLSHHLDLFKQKGKALKTPITLKSVPPIVLQREGTLADMKYEVARLELTYINRALGQFKGSKTKTAEALNIPSADTMKKTYINKYFAKYPELFLEFSAIRKYYKLF